MLIKYVFNLSTALGKAVFPHFSRNISALYIPGDKAKENFAALTPYMDFNEKLDDIDALTRNISQRQLKFNVSQLYQLWEMYKDVLEKRKYLEEKRIEIAAEMKKLASTSNENLKRKYQHEGIRIRDDLKALKEHLYPLEAEFISQYLSLPNDIHKDVPSAEHNVKPLLAHSQSNPNEIHQPACHLTHTNLIEYKNPCNYYLKGDAAKFDVFLPFYILDEFKEKGFIQFSNPDFLKTIGIEAAGLPPEKLFKIIDTSPENRLNQLHIVGNGSMLSYLGFISKLSILKIHFPLRFIASGKEYIIPENNSKYSGLYSVAQSTKVQLFIGAETMDDAKMLFDDTIQQMNQIYQMFDEDFRVIYPTADKLKQAECLRADFEMYSRYLDQYICIGNVCYYSDYISKRLLFNYKDGKVFKFPHLVSGTVIDIAKLLAISLENGKTIKLPFL